MQVLTYNHITNKKELYEGSDVEVKAQLFRDHHYLLTKYGWDAPIEKIVKDLDRQQLYSATISSIKLVKNETLDSNNPQFRNKDSYLEAIRAACEFLSGHKAQDINIRQALLAYDGDDLGAMLVAHNIVPNKANLEALEAVLEASLNKSEPTVISFKTVEPYNDMAKEFADMVSRANSAGKIQEIHFKTGKHSNGTLFARDPETLEAIILKPGSGKQNPALGENENHATQTRREGAFYSVAKAWELAEYMPECHILKLDGKEYAAMKFLSKEWVNGNDLKAEDPNKASRLLHMFLVKGIIHKWAFLDYVLGNPDRNAGNMMFCGPEVRLIDHGSAICGASFKPPIDKYSFVPYYLRVFNTNFKSQDPDARFKNLPRVNKEVQEELEDFISRLDESVLSKLLILYDIDPEPSLGRLRYLKNAVKTQPADLAINAVWVLS